MNVEKAKEIVSNKDNYSKKEIQKAQQFLDSDK